MPLFVNGEWFNPKLDKSDQPSAHKHYKDEWDEFFRQTENFKFPVKLKARRADKKRTDSKGTPVQVPATNLSYKTTIVTPNGAETWVLQEKFPEKIDDQYRFIDLGVWFRDAILVHRHERDKLFFLMKKTTYLRNILYHFDPAAKALERAQKEALKGQIYFLVYNSQSPIVSDQKKLKDIAKSFGVKKVDSLSLSEIQTQLFDRVMAGDDIRSKGPKAFVSECEDTPVAGKQARIQEAIEKELITFNKHTMEWRFKARDKETAVICKVDSVGGERKALLDYLKDHPEDENRILTALSTGRLSKLTHEDIDALSWEDLLRECDVAGIKRPSKGRDKEAVKDELREWVSFLENVRR